MSDDSIWQPLEIDPAAADGGDLIGFLSDTERVDSLLLEHKALVMRGFGVPQDGLDQVIDRVLRRRLAYVHGNSPRTKVGDNLYTSTEYPADQTISMHNEMSYAPQWPARLMFYCATAPATGGATPVVDGTAWLAALSGEVREAFSGGIVYHQNLHDGKGFGKSWQDTFETAEKAEVETYLKGTDAVWEWRRDGALRISQTRPATARHPVTGAEVWFNQADQWHTAALDPETAEALTELYAPADMPQGVTYADGSPIPDAHVLEVRDRGLETAVDVDWRQGDLLLIDNMLVGHGRRPFTGNRRVLVAMSD